MLLAWFLHSLIDLLFAVSTLSQFIDSDFIDNRTLLVKSVNKLFAHARGNPIQIVFQPLDMTSLHVVGFSDAYFANNKDHSTQIGYIIFVCDGSNISVQIQFKSYKVRRIVRSVHSGKFIALSDKYDTAHTVRRC